MYYRLLPYIYTNHYIKTCYINKPRFLKSLFSSVNRLQGLYGGHADLPRSVATFWLLCSFTCPREPLYGNGAILLCLLPHLEHEAQIYGQMECVISTQWNGDAISHAPVKLRLARLDTSTVGLEVEAPFFGDPQPAGPVGQPFPSLWDYEGKEIRTRLTDIFDMQYKEIEWEWI